MHTSHEHDDDLLDGGCGCSQCGTHEGPLYVDEDSYYPDEEHYDDPYDVVMYDIDAEADDLYSLINMLTDTTRSWYAKRRLNALAASGPLSALVADIIIDSLGRKWDPLLHPRDRYGRFINTGGFLRWLDKAGDWLRGRVDRIDSDGNIHVSAHGNDNIPDGSVYRFKPELASKLVSTESPVADLDLVTPDLDADIPDFPEASPIQKRIWNSLANGDMPAADLDRSMRDLDLTVEDFTGEVQGLEDRGLIEVDRTGDVPRVRRNDAEVKAVVDVGDDDVVDVPDDDTPDLDDSPALTKEQRDLLDFIADADNGEGDGVLFEELDNAAEEDIRALVDAGALTEGDDGRLFLENPEGDDAEPVAEIPDANISNEIFEAAQVIDDEAGQEAFIHFAEELSNPGGENNSPLPDDVSPAIQRRAQSAANAWWEERSGTGDGVDEEVLDQREADDFADLEPEVVPANPKDSLNPRNQALADTIMSEEFPEDEFAEWLESDIGVEYAAAVKRLFDAEDYDEAGFPDQAESERDKANRALQRLGAPQADIDGWPLAIQNFRNADREGGVPEATPETIEEVAQAADDMPDVDVPDADVPDAELPVDEDVLDQREADDFADVDPFDAEQVARDMQDGKYSVEDAEEAQALIDRLDEINRNEDQVYSVEDGEEARADIDAVPLARYMLEEQARGENLPFRPPADGDLPGETFSADDEPPEQPEPDLSGQPEPDVVEQPTWADFDRAMEMNGKADEFYARLDQENQTANDLELDLTSEDAPWSWEALSDGIGVRPAELLFNDSNGSLGEALTKDPDPFIRQYEDELLDTFQSREDGNYGPEVMRLRQAGLIEADGDNNWQLTQEGRSRLGIADAAPDETAQDEADLNEALDERQADEDSAPAEIPDDVDTELTEPDVEQILAEEEAIANEPEPVEEVVEEVAEARTLTDEERDLLNRIDNGGQARRSERTMEDALIDEGLLEEDDNGDSRLSETGRAAFDAEDTIAPDAAPEPEPDVVETPDADVTPDADEAAEDAADAADIPAFDDATTWTDWFKRVQDGRQEGDDLNEELVREKAVADELGLDLLNGNGLANWNAFVNGVNPDVAEYLYGKHDGDIGRASMDYIMDSDRLNNMVTQNTDADVPDADVPDAAPAATSAPTLPDPANPNADTPGFQRTGGARGLNAGGFYTVTEDNGPLKTGDNVYIKNGRSPEHAKNELLGNNLYGLAGVAVPEMYLGDSNDRLVSKIVPGVEPFSTHNPADRAVVDKVRSEFAIDAWIANWDGQMDGNTLKAPDGNPYRIDTGSAMEYRAQGGRKGAAFGYTIEELDNMRNPAVNYEAGHVFGPMSDDEVKDSLGQLAAINPDDIRSTILASDLPDKEDLADKMVARRSSALSQYGVADPHAQTDADAPDVTPDADTDAPAPAAIPVSAPSQQATQSYKTRSVAAQQKLDEFAARSNPHLEPQYDGNGSLVMADGSSLDPNQYYHTGKGGEGKHGLVVEVMDQERYPGLVRMRYQNGTEQIRHVLGVNSGKGGLRPSDQTDVDEWERQARVVGEQAEDVIDPADFPMEDGNSPLPGTQVVFDVGGEDQFGALLYFDHKYDNGGRAYIIPEGGGKVFTRPVRNIRAQTQAELDADASPIVPYEQGAVAPQYMPPARYNAAGNLLSREDQPINIGDWMAQRSGGDQLVGEVIGIPDQYLYPGWVTLQFPDGEIRARHAEGFTGVNRTRGAGGLRHADAPDADTWSRMRRVKGEEGDVLSYDFSDLETSDGTPIQVGEAVFGTGRNGQQVAGLLIRINPHMKRGGEVVPTGFVWQNDHEVPVDISRVTNTAPPTPVPQPFVPRPTVPQTPRTPRTSVPVSPARVTQTGTPPTPSRPTFTPPDPSTISNPPVAYTPGSGIELSDETIAEMDIGTQRLYTSPRTNGARSKLAAIYEAQNYDTLPQVVDQAEYARLVRDEDFVPIVRSVDRGTESTTNLPYHEAYKYGAYFAGSGMYGHGSYFAYGDNALDESQYYGPMRIYGLVKPEDLNIISSEDAENQKYSELSALNRLLQTMEVGSDEYKALKKKIDLYHNVGEWAAAKGYDGVYVLHSRKRGSRGRTGADELRAGNGYLVIFNRGATIVVDQPFSDTPDIFKTGLPDGLADQAQPPTPPTPPVPDVPEVPGDVPAVDADAPAADVGLAPGAAPGVV